MTPGERFRDWIDGLREWWGEALKNFLTNTLSLGFDTFFNVVGKAMSPKLKPLIDKIESTEEVPPELRPLLDELKKPTGQVGAIIGQAATYSLVGGAIGKILDAIMLPLAYGLNTATQYVMPGEADLVTAWRRGHIKADELPLFLHRLGLEDKWVHMYQELSEIRLDPATIAELYRRDPEKYAVYIFDLFHQGWSMDRIDAFKELVNIIPPLPDMVRFADFGAFDPKIIEMWRQFYDAPVWIREPMSKIGITGDWANKYWFSHWRQPGRFELGEMHRRGLIDDEIVKNAYLTQGFSSFWQNNLLELVKEPWTRVDIRRMWDMQTISEEEMRKAYRAVGYYDEWLEGMVLWTKVYVAFPDLVARWKNGWITEADVRSELTALGMPAARVEEMIQTKIKPAQPERIEKERDLTKSEIVKGVKKEYITWEDGVDLLVELGYDPTEADFILSIWIAVEAGSPETLPEFKALTQKWRRSVGKEAAPVPEELKTAANDVIRITREIEELNRAIKDEEAGLIKEEVLPEAATAQLDELRVTLHRAEASLGEARSRYDKQLALFRHRPTPHTTP